MKRYYVVLEVHHEADQLDAHEMATWVASAVGLASTGSIEATVYESAADLYFEWANQSDHPGYYCKECQQTFKVRHRNRAGVCCPHCSSPRIAGVITVHIRED